MAREPEQLNGLVCGTYGRRMDVRLRGSGKTVSARIKGKALQPVCGDAVEIVPLSTEADWLIVDILERRNVLSRAGSRGRMEILAANVDLLLAMTGQAPPPDWFVVDRYLAAAENMRARAAVIVNKSDLAPLDETACEAMNAYVACGYAVVHCSATTGAGFPRLEEVIGKATTLVVGQSGVGKSSVINRLSGGSGLVVGALSAATGEGRHTTVNSAMLWLAGGGAIIDSPGVRDFAPALDGPDAVIRGFREIGAAGERCRFANCLHLREPHCAVKDDVAIGRIDERRYRSYKIMLHKVLDATPFR